MDDPRYLHYSAGTVPIRRIPSVQSALAMGGVGLIVGAAGSAAANIRRLNDGKIDKGQAARNVIRDAAGAGVATAAATAVVGGLGLTGLLSVAGLLATATATHYLYDTAFEPEKEPATPQPAPKKIVKKTTTATKPAGKSAKTTKTTKTTAKKEA